MFCIYCFSPNTKVTNSRPSKKQPTIWRRRKCVKCAFIFTTYERPSLSENTKISLPSKKEDTFNPGKLTISIAKAFTHNPEEGVRNAFWLAQTVEDILSTQYKAITPEDIEAETYSVLKRIDELAAIQYAAQHGLITSMRRRGRPSLRERGQRTDE